MKNKNLKIVGLALLITTIIGIALNIMEALGKLHYVQELKSQKVIDQFKQLGGNEDYAKVTGEWMIYLGFALSPLSLLLVGYFNFVVWSSDKNGRTISKWPLIVVLVFGAISSLSPLLDLFTADSQFMLDKLKDIKGDGKWDAIKPVVKQIYDAKINSAFGWVGFGLSIAEVLISVPGIMWVKKSNA